MPEYRMRAAVPVDWLDDKSQPYLTTTSLLADTLLDATPLLVSDPVPGGPLSAKIRVNGREGIVRADRLKEALPGWNPATRHALLTAE